MVKNVIIPDDVTGQKGGVPSCKTWTPLEEILIWLDDQIDAAKNACDKSGRFTVAHAYARSRCVSLNEVREKLRSTDLTATASSSVTSKES